MLLIEYEVPGRFWFYAGHDMRERRGVVAFFWGWRPDAPFGEEPWHHAWAIRAPRWPLMYFHDDAGRIWPCGFMAFGYCRMYRWHLP